MNLCQSDFGQIMSKVVQLAPAMCSTYMTENPSFSQIYITQMAYLPKAVNYRRQFSNGTKHNILLYSTSGGGWCHIGVREYKLLPNQYILIPATDLSVSYGSAGNDSWAFYSVYFSGKDLNAFNRSFGLDHYASPSDVGYNTKGLEIWEEIYQRLSQGISQASLLHANLCLYHLLASFLLPDHREPPARNEDYIAETIAYLQERINEKLSVEDMAERLGFSVSYFSTLFRKTTGLPPLEYFIQLKLQNACQLLKDKGLKVKEVADAIGYDDPFHFSRLFKKHMKMSPLAYKSQARNSTQLKRITPELPFRRNNMVLS